MITLHTWSTPNGMKVQIMLEECGLPYRLHPVNLGKGQQHGAEFRALNPNGKIPVLVDDEAPGGPFVEWESGAILFYLAEKTGRFLAPGPLGRHRTLQWVMFQMSGLGPMVGQLHHFVGSAPERLPYAVDRFTNESKRILGVMDQRLATSAHLADAAYTIADICTWPWVRSWLHTVHQTLDGFPHVKRWFDAIEQRPAVAKAVETYVALRAAPKPA